MKKIAIVMPIYNQERYLRRALDTLCVQPSDRFVAICVDDGSTDASPLILKEYAARCPWMTIVTKPNGGLSSARNAGLDVAVTMPEVGWFTTFDPDDLMHPQWVEIVHHFASQVPDTIIGWLDQDEGEPEKTFLARRYEVHKLKLGARFHRHNVWSCVFPIEVVRDVRFFEGSSVAEDWAFHIEVAHRHCPHYAGLPAILNFYTIDPESLSHRRPSLKQFRERRAVVEYIIRVLQDSPKELAAFSRDQLPSELKLHWRALRKARLEDRRTALQLFRDELVSLRGRGLLHPKRGSLKDLKYYIRFLWETLREPCNKDKA